MPVGLCFFHCHQTPVLVEGSIFFLIILRTVAAFPPLGDEDFLYLFLALSLKRQRTRRSTEKAFCARTLNRWSQWQGHQVHGFLVMHRRGGRLTKLSKLTCPSGPEPQGPGSRVVADSSCPGKCSAWNTTWRRTVAWSLSILPEALTESKKEDNFSLSTACTCRGVWCSKDVGKIAVWKASGQEERRRTAQQQLRNV